MAEINVVTTFSPEGYDLYGKKCVESFLKHWPKEIILSLFCDPPLEKYDFSPILKERVRVLDLTAETAILDFATDWGWHPRLNHPTDYRFQGFRFCHKVFAMTADCLPKSGIRVWLDADTETTKPIDREYLERCFPGPDECCSYLGRAQWHHSETGWLAFALERGGLEFLDRLLMCYQSGQITQLAETHDAFAFDVWRKQLFEPGLYTVAKGWEKTGKLREGIKPRKFRDLSPNAIGLDAWNHSPLGERMIHRKGNLKLE